MDEARRWGRKIFDLDKSKASRKKVESYLQSQKPELVILNGHGHNRAIGGHDNEEIINMSNARILKNATVYARACSAGKVLGQEIVNQGAKAFIGYKEDFLFFKNEIDFKDPLKDDYAQPFFESSNQVATSLLKGKTPKEAHIDSMKSHLKWIEKLSTTAAGDRAFLIPFIKWNACFQVCITEKV
ncbi:MAG TPA: hypothetical protein VFT82_00775 [Candidatus Paceibacterota bacterium]|nr:hypothetical protein [Candidatus Paceibacterota bacterium]